MNECIFYGRVASEPVIQKVIKGEKENWVVNFNIAVAREYFGGWQTKDFLPCVCYGKMAEMISKNFNVGSKILVKTMAQSVRYKQNDKTFYSVQFNITRVYFVDEKGNQTVMENENIEVIEIPPDFRHLEEVETTPK